MLNFKYFYNRPRGDVNVKPSHHGPSQKSKKSSGKNGSTKSQKQPEIYAAAQTNNQQMSMNDMPIYSQVQKPVNSSAIAGGNNRNIIIGNGGQTNADSWV